MMSALNTSAHQQAETLSSSTTTGLLFYKVTPQSIRCSGMKGSVSIPGHTVPVSLAAALLRPKLHLQYENQLVIRISRQNSTHTSNATHKRDRGGAIAEQQSGQPTLYLADTDMLKNYDNIFVTIRSAEDDVAAKTELIIETAASSLYNAPLPSLQARHHYGPTDPSTSHNHRDQSTTRSISLQRMAKLAQLTLPLNSKSVTDRPYGQCPLCQEARRPGAAPESPHCPDCARVCCAGCYSYAADLCSPDVCPVCGDSIEERNSDENEERNEEEHGSSESSSASETSSSSGSSDSSSGGSDSVAVRGSRMRGLPLKVRRV